MPNLPIRGLGSVGVVTDVDPYNLPINGFTRGKNVRFHEGKVSHGPVFRDVAAGNQLTNPVFVHGVQAATGYDTVLVVTDEFDINEFSNGVFTQRYADSCTFFNIKTSSESEFTIYPFTKNCFFFK